MTKLARITFISALAIGAISPEVGSSASVNPSFDLTGTNCQTGYTQNGINVTARSGPYEFQGKYVDSTHVQGTTTMTENGCTALWDSFWTVLGTMKFYYKDDIRVDQKCSIPQTQWHMSGAIDYNQGGNC